MSDKNNCAICGENFKGFGHNAEPISRGRCCEKCNDNFVIPVRIKEAMGQDIRPAINKILCWQLDRIIASN